MKLSQQIPNLSREDEAEQQQTSMYANLHSTESDDTNCGNDMAGCSKARLAQAMAQEDMLNHEKQAMELCAAKCAAFGVLYNWESLPPSKKEGYRKMIDMGVKLA